MQIPAYFRLEGPYLRLEGQRCGACGKLQFPPRVTCRECRSLNLESVQIARTGTVMTYSEINTPPAGFTSPIIAALVALDDGVTVACQLTDTSVDGVTIGMPVEMVTRLISESGPEGCLIYGYKFRPRLE